MLQNIRPHGLMRTKYCSTKVTAVGRYHAFLTRVKKRFSEVKHVKPPASRKESVELYLVATGFRS